MKVERIADEADESRLQNLIQQYAEATGSVWARGLLEAWNETKE